MKPICEYLEEDRKKWEDRPYIYEKKDGVFQARTFGETVGDIKALAASLIQLGYAGQNIGLFADNSYLWMVIDLAVMGYVGTIVPLDKEWTEYELANVLHALPFAAVCYSASRQEKVTKLKKQFPETTFYCIETQVIPLIRKGRELAGSLTGRTRMEDTACILFTSGTTEFPKAIPLTQSNLLYNWDALCKRTPMTETDRSYLFLPLHHVYSGVANFLYSIISGMQLYLCSGLPHMAEEMKEIRPTVVCTVPLLMKRMYEAMDEELLECHRAMRFLYCGGSFMETDLKYRIKKLGIPLLEAYGTSETSSVIALERPGDMDMESAGVVMEGLEVKILEPDAEGFGEILVRGGSCTKGYMDEDGFYHTGDLGRLSFDRHLYLRGRKKRWLNTDNGKNIDADELEQLLLKNDAVKKARVFLEEEVITALLYTNLSEEEVRDYIESVNQMLAGYKKIRRIQCREERLGGRIK